MDNGRPGIPGHGGPFPAGPGRGAAVTGARDALSRESKCRRPLPQGWRRPSSRRPGAPRLPLPPHPQLKAGKTRNLGSGAEATDQVTARVGGSGRNSMWPRGWRREGKAPAGQVSNWTTLRSR